MTADIATFAGGVCAILFLTTLGGWWFADWSFWAPAGCAAGVVLCGLLEGLLEDGDG